MTVVTPAEFEPLGIGNCFPGMTASFDDNTSFAEDEEGNPICYDWLRDADTPPVRVQVKQAYVEKEWRLPWVEDAKVMQRFNAVERQHVDAALDAELLPGQTIGSTLSGRSISIAACLQHVSSEACEALVRGSWMLLAGRRQHWAASRR